MNLFDSSALLCFVGGEPGSKAVERGLTAGGAACSAANWSEVAQKTRSRSRDRSLVIGLLLSYDLRIEPVTQQDAERAATLWRLGSGMSLADRICLATGHRLGATVWTADKAWGRRPPIHQVR